MVYVVGFKLLFALILLSFGCSEQQQTANTTLSASAPVVTDNPNDPDAIYVNGRIYTVADDQTWAEAIAIKDGKFVSVGSNEDVQALAGADTELIDLEGSFAMPGVHDMHVHPSEGGEKYNFQCSFPFTHSMDQIVAKLTECAANTPKGEWIIGGQWANELIGSDTAPHKHILDAISTEHPIHLGDSTVHAGWLNSTALEAMGINSDTPNPNGGVIAREAGTTKPTGILIDNAYYETMRKLPRYSDAQYEQALQWAMAEMNKMGVTSIKDALTSSSILGAYKRLDEKGSLTMKVATSIGWRMAWNDTLEQERQNLLLRDNYRGKNVNTDFIKIMLDGIPPTRTAAMLEPYVPDALHGDKFTGKLIHTPEQLRLDLIELDALGLTVKIHATGDRSLRVALDAFEAARKVNGDSGLRHEVSHAELIHADDLPRFYQLNVTAEMSPILWYPSPVTAAMEKVIGSDRVSRFFPARSLSDSGALVVYGSDWPSVVPDPSPWPGIEAMVSRKDPYSNSGAELGLEEAVDLATAIRIFTRNGSVAAKSVEQTGTIEVGKQADFIVLDQNLFDIPVERISDVKVLKTLVDGLVVYQQVQ